MKRPSSTSKAMSRCAGDFVLRLLELKDPVIGGDNFATLDAAIRQQLLASGALFAGPLIRSITLFDEDCPRDVDLEWLPERGAYGYFSPAGYVVPDPASLQTYRLDIRWWLGLLSRELDLVGAGKPFELVEGHAWDIGDIWVSRSSKAPVLFARRLVQSTVAEQVVAAIRERGGRTGGLILTSSKRPPGLATWPHRFEAKTIYALMSSSSEVFSIDRDLLLARFDGSAKIASKERVHLSPDCRTLTIDAHEMTFRGIQQRIVRLLVEAHQAKTRLSTKDLLSKAGSRCPDLEKAFNNNRHWPTLRSFIRLEQGQCWINL